VYSIAPFCYARPFEQIRNDITFHGLPVKLIGNGGGYGYGVMGPTHHAIEDYGVLLTLPGMSVYAPVFDEDVDEIIARAAKNKGPTYVRVGRGEPPEDYAVPPYAAWRQLTHGGGPVVISVGPLAGTYIGAFESLEFDRRPNLWAVAELPIAKNQMPKSLVDQIKAASCVCVAEEHVRTGSFASDLLLHLAEQRIALRQFRHLYARSHLFDRYGSQPFLRQKSALDVHSMLETLELL